MPGKSELLATHSGLRSGRRYVPGLLFAIVVTGCADAPRHDAPPELDGGDGVTCRGAECAPSLRDCSTPAPGCPCAAPGALLACGHVESQVAEQTVCGKGYSVCSDAVWQPCVINNTAPLVRPASTPEPEPEPEPEPPGASHPLLLGKPTRCASNPCDPSCWDFHDTPVGEGNTAAGLFADDAGITLVASAAPPALYAAADFVREYDAVGICGPGTRPLWGLWSWKALTPDSAFIAFSVQTAASAAELSKAPVDALVFSNPPGPSALLGKPAVARRGPPDTTAGAAVVDTTLAKQGRTSGLPFLRLIAHLAPSSDGKSAPLLAAWDLQVSCAPSE